MSDDAKLHRDIGRLEATVEQLAESQQRTEQRVQAIHDVVMSAKGGWKTLVVVGSISSALTTAVIKFFSIFKGGQ